MTSPFLGGRIQFIDAFGFQRAMLAMLAMLAHESEVWPGQPWAGLHISPRSATSKKAKLCTYLRWFLPPERYFVEPYNDLPFPIKKLRSILQFRMGFHALPVELVEWVGLAGLLCLGICADAPSAPGGFHALPVELVEWVGLAGLLCLGICADAPSAPPGLLGMSGIAFLIALILVIFVIFGLTMRSCFS